MAIKKHTGNRIVELSKQSLSNMKSIKQLEIDKKATQDLLSAMTNERDELEVKVKEWERKQRDGYSWVVMNPDTKLILDGGTVLPYARFVYTQDMPSNLGDYHKLDSNGTVIEDANQKNKYESERLL